MPWFHPDTLRLVGEVWGAGITFCYKSYMRRANERWRYIVTSSLTGWEHTQDDHRGCRLGWNLGKTDHVTTKPQCILRSALGVSKSSLTHCGLCYHCRVCRVCCRVVCCYLPEGDPCWASSGLSESRIKARALVTTVPRHHQQGAGTTDIHPYINELIGTQTTYHYHQLVSYYYQYLI